MWELHAEIGSDDRHVVPGEQSAPSSCLSPSERRTLEAVCDTFFPALDAGPEDNAGLFAIDARSIGVPRAMEVAIALRSRPDQQRLRMLLRMIERPGFVRLLVGMYRPFAGLSQPERETLLLRMATSRWPVLRGGFQALKRLATFLSYSVLDETTRTNPTWSAIGYAPSSDPPAAEARLRVTTLTRPTTLECDVCVIGSGAGGSVVAAELAAAGQRVVVLEAGSAIQAPDFEQRELPGLRRLFLDRGMSTTHDLGISLLAGATIGGGTTVNWQTSLAPPPAIRDEWATISGCRHFVEPSFSHAIEAVTTRLSVGTDESLVNPNNACLRDGCAALGYHWATLPRNARGCDVEQCGYCCFGCRHGGKQSTAITYLHDAQRSGDTTIVAHCRAERVTIVRGRVTGVDAVASDPTTNRPCPVRVEARRVVVAAGGLHSPAVLLRSGVELPTLGNHLFLHPTSAVAAVYDHKIEAWNGPPQTIVSDQVASLQGNYGARLEAVPAHPGLMALSLPWLSARDHRSGMQHAANTGSLIVLTRDRQGGRVRIGRGGQPVYRYRPDAEVLAHMRRGIEAAVRVHLAAGARAVSTLHVSRPVLRRSEQLPSAEVDRFCEHVGRLALHRNWSTIFSAHQMGTCRMGSDPRTAVCNSNGQVFGVGGLYVADASAFPASSGVNPMITIMALAHHVAQSIKEE